MIGGAVDPEFLVSVMPDHVIVWVNAGDPYEVQVVDGAGFWTAVMVDPTTVNRPAEYLRTRLASSASGGTLGR